MIVMSLSPDLFDWGITGNVTAEALSPGSKIKTPHTHTHFWIIQYFHETRPTTSSVKVPIQDSPKLQLLSTAFQSGCPGSISDRVRNFNFYPGTECMSFACVLPCFVSGYGPNNVLTTLSGRPALVYVWCSGPQCVAAPIGI